MADTSRKIAGVDVLLQVKDSTGKLITVAGQTGGTLNLSAASIDVTDKTSDGWKTSLAGLREWNIDQSLFYTLGDTSNKLMFDAFFNRTAIEISVRLGENSEIGGTTFTGKAFITDFPLDLAQDNAVSVSMKLAGASALVAKHGVVTP